MERYQRILKYVIAQWRSLRWIILLTVLASGMAAISPLPMKLLVDYGLTKGGLPWLENSPKFLEWLNTPAVLIVASAIGSVAFYAISRWIQFNLTMTWVTAGQQMVADLSSELFAHLQRLSLMYHSRADTGDNLARLSYDTYVVSTVAKTILISPLKNILTLLFIGYVAWKMSPTLTLLSLAVAPAMGASAYFFGGRIKTVSKQEREIQSQLVSFVHQTLTSIPIVQTFSTEEKNVSQFHDLASEAVSLSKQQSLTLNKYQLINGSILVVGSAIVIFAGAGNVLSQTLSLGSLLIFLSYLNSLQSAFSGIFEIYGNVRNLESQVERVFEVLELDEYVQEKPNAKRYPVQWAEMDGRIRMEGVRFGYDRNHPILHGVDLEIHAGETVALVGKTGAGKSTLAAFIPRFIDPWFGYVFVNGMDVREMQLSSLREHIAVVLQDAYLLPTTIAENIAFGSPDASRIMIVEAAERAHADEFIRNLPHAYDTVIGKQGYSLSGGEKQRIAVARALLKDSPILILDEPTSAIDSQTEEDLLDALNTLMEGRTVLMIAHRLSTIQRADRILVLDNGFIAESGTHNELLSLNGKYASLHKYQEDAGELEAVE